MTYREVLERYRAGLLEDRERAEVAREIEKHEAISDYLYKEETIPEFMDVFGTGSGKRTEPFENEAKPFGNKSESPGSETAETKWPGKRRTEKKRWRDAGKNTDFVTLVNQSIRRAFLKFGAAVLAVSVVLVLFIQFLLPNLVSACYYDPGKAMEGGQNQMSLDMAVYSELFLPCRRRSNVVVNEKGYGTYNIDITQNVSLNGQFTTVSGEITRGELRLYNGDMLKRPTGNCFAWSQVIGDLSRPLSELEKDMSWEENGERYSVLMSAAGDREQARESAEGLSEESQYIGYVSLDQMMDYEAFAKWVRRQELGEVWCAVQTEAFGSWDEGEQYYRASNIGFILDPMSSSAFVWDEQKYPKLINWNIRPAAETAEGSVEAASMDGAQADVSGQREEICESEADMTAHFASLLRYLADQKQFLRMLGGSAPLAGGILVEEGGEKPGEELRNIADYVEENGIRVYGFAAVMDRETVLDLMELPEVYIVYTEAY